MKKTIRAGFEGPRPVLRVGVGGFQHLAGLVGWGQQDFESHGSGHPDSPRPDPTRPDPTRPDPTRPDSPREILTGTAVGTSMGARAVRSSMNRNKQAVFYVAKRCFAHRRLLRQGCT